MTLDLFHGAIATSGDYEYFVEIDGRRCRSFRHATRHAGLRPCGLSVAAPECVVAGSATTIATLMEDRGAQWLDEVGLPHVWMDQQLRVGGTFATAGT